MAEIRSAAAADMAIIHDLAHIIWPHAYLEILSRDQVAYMLRIMYNHDVLKALEQRDDHKFLIASQKGLPVGFALYHPKIPTDISVYQLSKIYVHPLYQDKGIGKQILEYIIDNLQLLRVSTLELNVNRNNRAISFYQKLGFKITREVDLDIGNGYFMNDYVMEKSISFGLR